MCDDNCEITIKNGNLTYVSKNATVEITEDCETTCIEIDMTCQQNTPNLPTNGNINSDMEFNITEIDDQQNIVEVIEEKIRDLFRV